VKWENKYIHVFKPSKEKKRRKAIVLLPMIDVENERFMLNTFNCSLFEC